MPIAVLHIELGEQHRNSPHRQHRSRLSFFFVQLFAGEVGRLILRQLKCFLAASLTNPLPPGFTSYDPFFLGYAFCLSSTMMYLHVMQLLTSTAMAIPNDCDHFHDENANSMNLKSPLVKILSLLAQR